jgi:hypothetical protein
LWLSTTIGDLLIIRDYRSTKNACQNLYTRQGTTIPQLVITTPKSNPSKHYKHFRKAVAFAFRKLELCWHCRFRAGSFSCRTFVPDSGVGTCILTAMVILPYKTVEIIPVLNETHTNSNTGRRLINYIKLQQQYIKLQ